MATKRLFSRDVIGSDAFLDMDFQAQALYIQLCLEADDYGFVSAPKKVQRFSGADQSALKNLQDSNFVHIFESGVLVILHWNQNNTIPESRRGKTLFTKEFEQLEITKNGVYQLVCKLHTNCMQNEAECMQNECDLKHSASQYNISKVNINKYKFKEKEKNIKKEKEKSGEKRRKRFSPPTPAEVDAYCHEKGYDVDGETFCAFYASKGWKIGKNPMVSWKSACVTWHKKHDQRASGFGREPPKDQLDQLDFSEYDSTTIHITAEDLEQGRY